MEQLTPSEPAPPRAFAQGLGVVLQAVGGLLFLVNCCVCSLSGLWNPNLTPEQAWHIRATTPEAIDDPAVFLRDPARLSVTVVVLVGTVGGLALATLGLGMQTDRAPAATAAAALATGLAVLFAGATWGLWRGDVPWFFRLWHAGGLLALLVLTPMTWAAWRQVRRHPPPPPDSSVPPGFDVRDVLAGEKPSRMKIAELRAKIEQEQRELDRLERLQRGEAGPDDSP